MPITLKDFYESGKSTKEQKELLENFVTLAKREIELSKKVNEIHRYYQEEARREGMFWGFSFKQISDLVIEQEIAPGGYAAAKPYQDKLDEVRKQMREDLIIAVSKYNLGFLGIIQRQYPNYVGGPIPNIKQNFFE